MIEKKAAIAALIVLLHGSTSYNGYLAGNAVKFSCSKAQRRCPTVLPKPYPAKNQVDLTAYRFSPSGARLFLVRINLKNLLSAFGLPV